MNMESEMRKRPRVLILMHYMELGGAESALLGLLQSVDPMRVDVDVFIYSHRGELMQYVPTDKVHLLDEVKAYSLTEKPIKEVLKEGYLSLAIARLIGIMRTRQFCGRVQEGDRPYECAPFFQQSLTWRVLPQIKPDVEYDLAISFMTPHFFVLNNVRAKKKMGWIHTDYTRITVDVENELRMWGKLDYIASISHDVGERFCDVFPSLRSRIIQIENILNPEFIKTRADEEVVDLHDGSETVLLTIGRYSAPKRMEIIPELCRRVRDAGVDVKWYIIGYGNGDVEKTVRENMKKENVENHVVLLGKKDNPYPYIKACDVYVQPSKYEGKSITVREAQIMGKPVIVSNYPTAKSQVIDGEDGIIVPLDVADGANALASFLKDACSRRRISQYLSAHDYGNVDEIEKIYKLLL